MTLYVDGVLKPPADAGSLDGIPADLQPAGAGQNGYVVTYVNATGDLELQPGGGGGAPSTLAEQAILVADTRLGPVTMTGWTDSDYVAPIATPASGAQPLVTLGSSGVAVVYSSQAGGYASTHFFASHDPFAPTPPRGFAMGAGGSDITLVSITAGFPFVSFVGVIAAVGWASVAWSIDGAGAVRYSIGTGTGSGSAAGPAAGTLAALLPRTTDPVRIGAGVYAGIASSLPVSYLALWPSILSDADLEQLASSPASGAPILPSSPAWEWAAAGHVGCGRVSIGADVYRVVGAPALWMP